MKDDYIKRQDILDAIWKVDPENDGSDGCTIVYKNSVLTSADVESIIDGIQAAEVREVVHARWVKLNSTQEHFCDNCGVSFNLYEYCKADYNYCPYCGAQMDRGEDDG